MGTQSPPPKKGRHSSPSRILFGPFIVGASACRACSYTLRLKIFSGSAGPNPLPGLRPWSSLGDFHLPDPLSYSPKWKFLVPPLCTSTLKHSRKSTSLTVTSTNVDRLKIVSKQTKVLSYLKHVATLHCALPLNHNTCLRWPLFFWHEYFKR